MRKLSSILLAAALMASLGALVPAPVKAVEAVDPCLICDMFGECLSCCRCEGGSALWCKILCGGSLVTTDIDLKLDAAAPMCDAAPVCVDTLATADDEAPSSDETPSTADDEAPSNAASTPVATQ